MTDPGYDPDRVREVLERLEENSTKFNNSELQAILLAKDALEKGEEVPRWVLVKFSMMSRKIR